MKQKDCSTKLKDLILDNGIIQADLARYVQLSPSSINIIINCLRWPKKNTDFVKARFREFLVNAKISESEIDDAFNEMFDAPPQKHFLKGLAQRQLVKEN